MQRYNQPHRKTEKRTRALNYWKAQLDPKTRSTTCLSKPEYIQSQIKALEAKLKGAA